MRKVESKKNSPNLTLDYHTLLDFLGIVTGLFAPLKGFMDASEFRSVVDNMVLPDGSVFTVPVTLPIIKDKTKKLIKHKRIYVMYEGEQIGYIKVKEIFNVKDTDYYKVFNTKDRSHPGLLRQLSDSQTMLAGECVLTNKKLPNKLHFLTPDITVKEFKERKWNTIVGFHTRNAIHKAHEHLQRTGLELCDGLLISPFMGWKKKGDFTEQAIKKSYDIMINDFYPKERVLFHGLLANIRYAGPREAIFTAILRRNLGCTHFIVGRDHSGVGNYYGKYESQELVKILKKKYDLGINILLLSEPYFCKKCGETVSDKNCRHKDKDIVLISGTKIRKSLSEKALPPAHMMRPEVAKALEKLDNIFIE